MNLVVCGKSQCGVRSFVKNTLLFHEKCHIVFTSSFQYIFKIPKGFSHDTSLLLMFKITLQFSLDQKYYIIKIFFATNVPNSSLFIFDLIDLIGTIDLIGIIQKIIYLRNLANNDH